MKIPLVPERICSPGVEEQTPLWVIKADLLYLIDPEQKLMEQPQNRGAGKKCSQVPMASGFTGTEQSQEPWGQG